MSSASEGLRPSDQGLRSWTPVKLCPHTPIILPSLPEALDPLVSMVHPLIIRMLKNVLYPGCKRANKGHQTKKVASREKDGYYRKSSELFM